jgi:hypothetical protein
MTVQKMKAMNSMSKSDVGSHGVYAILAVGRNYKGR